MVAKSTAGLHGRSRRAQGVDMERRGWTAAPPSTGRDGSRADAVGPRATGSGPAGGGAAGPRRLYPKTGVVSPRCGTCRTYTPGGRLRVSTARSGGAPGALEDASIMPTSPGRTRGWKAGALVAVAVWVAAPPAAAQDHVGQYEQADIEFGARLYDANPRAVPCRHGRPRPRGWTSPAGSTAGPARDAELMGLLRAGIPGTATPPNEFTSSELIGLVAYLRTMRDLPPERGHPGPTRRGARRCSPARAPARRANGCTAGPERDRVRPHRRPPAAVAARPHRYGLAGWRGPSEAERRTGLAAGQPAEGQSFPIRGTDNIRVVIHKLIASISASVTFTPVG